MKKLSSIILGLAVLFSLAVFTSSCDDTEKNPPTISVSDVNDGGTYTLTTLPTIKLVLGSNDADLYSLTIDIDGGLAATIANLTSNPTGIFEAGSVSSPFIIVSGNQNVTVYYTPIVTTPGTVSIQFTVTDENDKLAQELVTFTVTADAQIVENNVTLGAQDNVTGSFCASFEGNVFSLSEVPSNYATIDLIYYYGASNLECLFSPDDADVQTITWNGVIDWSNWNPKNQTRFVKLTSFDFANCTANDISTAVSGPTLTKANNLVQDDVYGFTTVSGREGVFMVSSLAGGATGTITLDIKLVD